MTLPISPRHALATLAFLGLAGALLFLPAVSMIGGWLASPPTPIATPLPPLLAEAIWARSLGGRSKALQPINPFTIGRVFACLIRAERNDPGPERDRQQNECMTLLPGVQAVGYLSSVHMRNQGVWQDPRVPFVQISQMTKISSNWSREELLSTVAKLGSYGTGIVGFEHASRVYFAKAPQDLSLGESALLAAVLGDRQFGTKRIDPWCDPAAAAAVRRPILERMRDNGVIDDAAFESANRSELGLADPPADHAPCAG